jgi:hypothetical protein
MRCEQSVLSTLNLVLWQRVSPNWSVFVGIVWSSNTNLKLRSVRIGIKLIHIRDEGIYYKQNFSCTLMKTLTVLRSFTWVMTWQLSLTPHNTISVYKEFEKMKRKWRVPISDTIPEFSLRGWLTSAKPSTGITSLREKFWIVYVPNKKQRDPPYHNVTYTSL